MPRFARRQVVSVGIAALCLAAAAAAAVAPPRAVARDLAVGLAAPPTSFDPHLDEFGSGEPRS